MRKKILFAVGGTGGHVYPAQALARELLDSDSDLDILFGGGRLSSNPYFDQSLFPFREVASSSPLRSNPLKASLKIFHGVRQSLRLIREYRPDLLIGFGSFYSFPLLVAARLKKIPYLLVESNAVPGRVNRLFSKSAELSAIQFDACQSELEGETTLAKIPFWASEGAKAGPSREEALAYYGLESGRMTLLIFGGSQGARVINSAVSKLELDVPFQVIHFSGEDEQLASVYQERGIPANVKRFERNMEYAWRAADLAICRSGAATLSEMIAFCVPAILIPWPGATDQHQLKNASVVAQSGGARILLQNQLSELSHEVGVAVDQLTSMKKALEELNRVAPKETLAAIVQNYLRRKS